MNVLEPMPAVFRDGAFHPQQPCDLPNESKVLLFVESSPAESSGALDEQERRKILERVTMRMRNNPLPANDPKITRDWIHERG
jgi:hypothetical protein